MTEHSKHTPGPWRIEYDPYCHVRSDAGCVLASDYTTEANASLIAAAPDLLHELRTSRCPGGGYTGQPENEEPTVENCLKVGNCGCSAGAAVKKATSL